ncbi:MAG: pyrimidine-nucleoside phosphorylase [Aggregatilineales bacterium]|nr:pyrimidine-nucleoside phosphorylase [Chloroflexota bacterium]HOA23287.1 pyrimidine-nucleoside phosphorylase [Aggregatilineales bacterium]HPV05638.1 pyrimidine-nucleoside phosphorylase [Aggregatilineales bacterium]
MNVISIIEKKRDGYALTEDEIRYFVRGYTADDIPDYQAAAWAMAVYLQGMNRDEIIALTMALAQSGDMIDLHEVIDFAVDKHSSGGVGDKTSLVVLPLVAAFGVPVAKMSGRGLSFTGGTLDKLESIDGYNVNLTEEQFLRQVQEVGIVLAGQTRELAPADGKLYALRDVTGTVSSIPLIASSIMSKKIASGADAIVLDVKVGSGAFMRTVEDARRLAQLMVEIGTGVGRRVTALLSDMNQPLGNAVGNALEVREAIDTLRGGGPADLIEHCITVAGHMLRLAGKSQAEDLSDIRPQLEEKLANGEAFEVFKRLIAAQGGDVSQVEEPARLPTAPVIVEVESPQSGYLRTVDALEIGLAAADLGAGRKKKGDPVDHAVGLVVHHKVGEYVEKGDRLFTIHARTEDAAAQARERVLAAHEWADRPGIPLFYDVITGE